MISSPEDLAAGLPANVVLVGFMGCGKTTLGRLLAERLGWKFVDVDAVVERTAGCTIPEIFARDGEAAFRDRENRVLLGVCAGMRQVIATGGGAVLRDDNVAAIRSAGLVVWLTARPDVILARTRRRVGTRPLLSTDEDPLERILRLLGERGALYRMASDRTVDTSDRPVRAVATELERVVRQGQGGAARRRPILEGTH